MRGSVGVRALVAAAVVAVVAVAGCSFSTQVGDAGTSLARTPPSIVHDHHVALDFRQTPSRADFGLPADQNWRSYAAEDHQVNQLMIRLPAGVLQLPAHDVDGATDRAGGATDSDHHHLPKFFTIDVLYPSDAAADAALAQQYTLLGIHHQNAPLGLLLSGSPSPQLSVTVQRHSNLTASLSPGQRYYYFDFDQYRNPAIDAVLHDGRMSLDMRERPSRSELGFLDGYDRADIATAPSSNAVIRLTLRTPHGTTDLAVDSITSSSGGSAQPQLARQSAAPALTELHVVSTVAVIQEQLRQSGLALGLAPPALAALIAGSPTNRTVQLTTPVYSLSVDVTVDSARTDAFAASVSYTFTYH